MIFYMYYLDHINGIHILQFYLNRLLNHFIMLKTAIAPYYISVPSSPNIMKI